MTVLGVRVVDTELGVLDLFVILEEGTISLFPRWNHMNFRPFMFKPTNQNLSTSLPHTFCRLIWPQLPSLPWPLWGTGLCFTPALERAPWPH